MPIRSSQTKPIRYNRVKRKRVDLIVKGTYRTGPIAWKVAKVLTAASKKMRSCKSTNYVKIAKTLTKHLCNLTSGTDRSVQGILRDLP